LHTGPTGLGILLAATSIGAVALTPLTVRIGRISRQGLGVVLAILVWGLCIVAFGFAPGPIRLSVLFLAGAGAADMVSMILRGLVIQLTTPDEFRGRMSAVNTMFVISGPMLGQFESGLVAGLFTPPALRHQWRHRLHPGYTGHRSFCAGAVACKSQITTPFPSRLEIRTCREGI
jgi:MFS family permease